MKKCIFFSTLIFLSFAFVSCEKNPVVIPKPTDPIPTDTGTLRTVTFVFKNVLGNQPVTDSLIAKIIISKTTETGDELNISMPVVFNQKYSTQSISVPKGPYTLKKMVLVDSSGIARFATPVTGSAKSTAVNKPLAFSFTLEEKVEKQIEVELLSVFSADRPEHFGYPEGSFGNRDSGADMDKFVFIHPVIKIGDVIYNSIPAQLIVRTWNDKNEMTYNIHYLRPGKQGVYLSAKGVKHQLSVSKWGTYDEMILAKADILDSTAYIIGGEVAAKKLKTVYEYKIVDGVSTPVTKTDFEYHTDGKVKQKQLLGKRADNSNYVMHKEVYAYAYNKIVSINRYNEHSLLQSTTTVEYDNANGRIISMQEKSNTEEIRTTVSYTALETRSGISQDYRIDAQHHYGHGLPVTYYSKTIVAGRVLKDLSVTDNGNREEGMYEYDACINPYVHLGIPDRQFRLYEKHNLSFQWKTWYAGYPENEAYSFNYTYNGDGYPTELITKYRSFQTKKDTYSIKTVYVY